MRPILLSAAALMLAACSSPLDPLASGFNRLIFASSGLPSTAASVPTSGGATYEGLLLLSPQDGGRALADFIGDTTLNATFDAGGAALSGAAQDFVNSDTAREVAGTIALTNGRIDRTSAIADPEGSSSTGALLVNADGTITDTDGTAYAVDGVIFGDVVGPFGLYLTGTMSGDVATGGRTVAAGGQLVTERVD
ncbi:hypothetical protein [Maritimibacter sp. UBA3975]|uniref:hypothetical protein n=1 Tax=Maritimibacter sp. UBA3975 TaxID=1946833 RepID=UPI000C09E108|nr:hypothetical protein [Maritimibacter sp. UBA3975]MAM62604.1 hypothetical protein [Maritimibacter sp.]|tara:strand:+ start:1069 stop:1650 length:582 start_codon:yes stop_codon:yes gene_type:complete